MFDYSNAEPAVGLGAFLDYIWGDINGYAYLVFSDPGKERNWVQKKATWPKEREKIVGAILDRDKLGQNVYIAPAIFDIEKYTANPGFVKENILGSNVYWSEYDGDAPSLPALGATQSDVDPTSVVSDDSASQWLSVADTPGTEKTGVPPASLRVQSGYDGHEHHYWKSETFITDLKLLEEVNRSITYATVADTSGWDCTQVLRPPYTRNHKYKDKPAVTVSYASDVRYPSEAFVSVPKVQQVIGRSIDLNDLPTVESIVVKYAWSNDDYELFSRETIPEGQRSSALMNLGYVGAEMGMQDTELYAILQNADDRWKKYIHRTDRKWRLLDIVNRAFIKHPRPISETTFASLRGLKDVNGNGIEITQDIWTFKNTVMAEEDWVITDFLERQGIGLVASSPGVGKTQLSLQLAYACALGTPFLKWTPVKPIRIQIFSLEMSYAAMRMFTDIQLKSYEEDFDAIWALKNNCKISQIGHSLSIASEDNREFIGSEIEKYEPQGIIIDSLGKLTNSKLDEEVSRKISNFLDELKTKYDCFVWLIHHNRKSNSDNKRPTSLDDVFGSTYITANVSTALSLYQEVPQSPDITVYVNKIRSSAPIPPFRIHRGSDLQFSETTPTFDTLIGGEKNDGNSAARPERLGDS
jgi:hypothetical protein